MLHYCRCKSFKKYEYGLNLHFSRKTVNSEAFAAFVDCVQSLKDCIGMTQGQNCINDRINSEFKPDMPPLASPTVNLNQRLARISTLKQAQTEIRRQKRQVKGDFLIFLLGNTG